MPTRFTSRNLFIQWWFFRGIRGCGGLGNTRSTEGEFHREVGFPSDDPLCTRLLNPYLCVVCIKGQPRGNNNNHNDGTEYTRPSFYCCSGGPSPGRPTILRNATGFSTVYLVRDTRSRESLAMKRMLCQERDTTEAAYREVQVLRAVRHRNVISLIEQVCFDVSLVAACSRVRPRPASSIDCDVNYC